MASMSCSVTLMMSCFLTDRHRQTALESQHHRRDQHSAAPPHLWCLRPRWWCWCSPTIPAQKTTGAAVTFHPLQIPNGFPSPTLTPSAFLFPLFPPGRGTKTKTRKISRVTKKGTKAEKRKRNAIAPTGGFTAELQSWGAGDQIPIIQSCLLSLIPTGCLSDGVEDGPTSPNPTPPEPNLVWLESTGALSSIQTTRARRQEVM